MGYRLNRLDEPVLIAVSKPLLTEFGVYHKLESCGVLFFVNSFEQLQDTGTIFLQFTKATTPRPTETGKIPKAFE